MNFEVDFPNKEEIIAQQGEDKGDQEFDWKDEFNFIDKESVKLSEVSEEITRDHCKGKIITLEDDFFDLDCHVQTGIKVIDSSIEEAKGIVVESLDNLLMKFSPKYEENFCKFEEE